MSQASWSDADRRELFDAIRRRDAPAVVALIDRHPELARAADTNGKTALHWSAETDQPELARALLDRGADLEATTSWGATALDWAATMGHAKVGDVLVSRGATGLTLVVAAGLGYFDRVRRSVEAGGDLSRERRRGAPDRPTEDWPADSAHMLGDVISDAMYAAARNGHADIVEYLLARGAAADAKGIFGASALHWAAFNGHRSTVDVLVQHGARLDLRDARFNATPAGWALEAGHQEIADRIDERRR